MKFNEFPKLSRFSRHVIISEKIDGTNASIFIQNVVLEEDLNDPTIITILTGFESNTSYTLRAGSRTKWITPKDDNHGFANWVLKNALELSKLGEGHHFGEWWGSGIQRGYGLQKGEKRFSLFNTSRWSDSTVRPSCCSIVPVLWEGSMDTINESIETVLEKLRTEGSQAVPGYLKPEGIVIYHVAGNLGFKKTLEKDEIPKSLL
jgi:hypothetical protein